MTEITFRLFWSLCELMFHSLDDELLMFSVHRRSNLMGTKFTVYDNGTNPSKTPGALLEETNTRQELAAICYVSVSVPLCF